MPNDEGILCECNFSHWLLNLSSHIFPSSKIINGVDKGPVDRLYIYTTKNHKEEVYNILKEIKDEQIDLMEEDDHMSYFGYSDPFNFYIPKNPSVSQGPMINQ